MSPPEAPKRLLYAELTRVAKALSSASRLELIEHLAQGERAVEPLARATGLSVANASHHLLALRDAHLVETRREGLHVFYRLAGSDVFDLFRMLRLVGERRLAEVDRMIQSYIAASDELTPVTRRELVRRVEEGASVVIDVRTAEEYRAGHIEGAISVPLRELDSRLPRLGRGKEIVAYCRGPYCLLSSEAVQKLRAKGRDARRLEEGYPEWRAEGLPVASGEGVAPTPPRAVPGPSRGHSRRPGRGGARRR